MKGKTHARTKPTYRYDYQDLTAHEMAVRCAHMDSRRCATCGKQRWMHYYGNNTCIFVPLREKVWKTGEVGTDRD